MILGQSSYYGVLARDGYQPTKETSSAYIKRIEGHDEKTARLYFMASVIHGSDGKPAYWGYDYITALADLGVVGGDNGKYKPNAGEHVGRMLGKALKAMEQ